MSVDQAAQRRKLEAALDIAAELVSRDGEQFLPFFLRIEAELKAMESTESALDRARLRAAG